MRTGWRIAALAAVVGLGVGALARTPVRAQFRSDVEMVPLTVTVTDRAGRYVPNLTSGHFTILEDGKPQPVSYFAAEQAPVDLAFLLDNSSSMHQDLALAKEAACGLTRRLKPGDRAAVAGIASNVSSAQAMTPDLRRVEEAIRSLQAFGATAIYEGVYIMLRDFQRASRTTRDVRREAIVLLSDGLDNASHISFDYVLDSVRRGDVAVYVILLERHLKFGMDSDENRDSFEAGFAMRALARESGGRIFTPQSASELPAVYGAIADELKNQYLLGYVPVRPAGDGTFRRISVHVQHSVAAQARTRAGYYASRPRPAHGARRSGS